MTNPNLTPETRVNKHGVPVVKHVRPQPSSSSSTKSVPAPVTADTHIKRMYSLIKPLIPSHGRSPEHYFDVFRSIGKANPSLLTAVTRSYVYGTEEERAVWRNAFHATDDYDYEYEKHYRRMIEVIPMSVHLYPDAPPGVRFHWIDERARAVEQRVQCDPGYENYGQVKAEMILASTMEADIHPFDRQDRVAFMAENMESLIPFIPQLIERKDTSIELMRSLLETPSPSLAEGVL